MVAGSFPFLYAFYELPKRIVNEAITAKTTTYPLTVFGFEFSQIDYLFTLCGLFLALVFINQSFKYIINVYRGLTGERMLRRLRFELYWRVLRFPQPTFRKMSQGEIIQMINAEVEPLGGFIGDSFSLPAFQGGTLLVTLGFMVAQDIWLAAAAVMFYPVQFYVIPKLQRRVNNLAKQRVRLVRALSDRIGETVAGVQEVHVHNTARYELAEFSRRLSEVFHTRYQIFLWKFVIKFINNAVNQLGPFFFYSIGGYFVIEGRLEIGTLVAVLAANKDLAAPWKELLNYYQRREDARIKYEQVVEQFQQIGMMDEQTQIGEPEEIAPLSGLLSASGVRLDDDTGHTLVDGASFEVAPDEHVAIVGAGGSGKDHLAMMLARLVEPTGGSLTVNGAKLADLPEALTGRRIAYVGSATPLFSASVRDNLYYALKHRPIAPPDYDDAASTARTAFEAEAVASGNSVDDLAADWMDYSAAGVEDPDALTRRALEVLQKVDMGGDIYEMGLRGAFDPAQRPELAERLLEARRAFYDRLADPQLAPLVEAFDPDRYNDNATVGENLLFGRPVGNTFDFDQLAEHPYVLEVLAKAGLADDMLRAGRQVASTMVELFADLPPGHEFFDRYSFISHDDLPVYQALLSRLGREGAEALKPEERTLLLSLPFRLSPARHRLDVVDDALKEKIMQARLVFWENLPPDLHDTVERFDRDRYTTAASLQDNILFGKIAYGQARGHERISAVIAEVVDEIGLRDAVMEVGLDYQVGIGGGRLSSAQRQKLALARALLKRPDILVLNEATAAIDRTGQVRVMENILKEFEGRCVIWVLHRASHAERFGRVLVMQGGRLAEQGSYTQLNKDDSILRDLVAAE